MERTHTICNPNLIQVPITQLVFKRIRIPINSEDFLYECENNVKENITKISTNIYRMEINISKWYST